MEPKIVMKNMSQYKSSFFFGIKLIILLSLFVVFPFIGVTIGSWIDNATQKIPVLYVSSLQITAMQDFKFEVEPQYWWRVDLTSGATIYFALNRKFNNPDEARVAQKEAVDLLNNTYSVKQIRVEKGTIYSFPDYYGTAIYGHHTKIGDFIVVPINIILFILCVASYFPLFKAIFNLFRHKKIFL